MNRTDDENYTALEALFLEARAAAPVPSEDLLARISADAMAERTIVTRPSPPVWQAALDGIGGWFGLGGLAAATLTGIYIGFADPTFVTITDAVALTDDIGEAGDFLPGDALFFEEG